ncbi:MAG: 4,5-DOPA dioxygenase extradiol [Bacteroidetes bacterium]|nr:4,5-DOPA dioxygenase extradiol [Bacteroidota bacterium]
MTRPQFFKSLAALFASFTLVPRTMNATAFSQFTDALQPSPKMPVLFLGHGSPMNAIEENEFVRGFRKVATMLPKPQAILCISAHWETKGTLVTAMQHPKTIHDFGGFPKALYDVQYPAPGSPELARTTQKLLQKSKVGLDDQWGLDHGAWSVLKHMYPLADVPVVQMSIDYTQPAAYHFELAQELTALREKGVLIVGSGNMVHNLRLVAWDKLHESYAHDWALEASTKMKNFLLDGDFNSLIQFQKQGNAFQLAIPTPEHYLPLLYTLALKGNKDTLSLFNDKPVAGSLTMTSVKIDAG